MGGFCTHQMSEKNGGTGKHINACERQKGCDSEMNVGGRVVTPRWMSGVGL